MTEPDIDWTDVATNLQLRSITAAEMPRLLHRCILDLQEWQERARGLLEEIATFQTRIDAHSLPQSRSRPADRPLDRPDTPRNR